MRNRRSNNFATVRVEGHILPPDLIQRIADGDNNLGGLTPESFHLIANEKINEAVNRSWNRLLAAWANFKSASSKLPESDTGTSVTRERWLLPFFQELGYGRLPRSQAVQVNNKSYPISHWWSNVPIHLVSFKVELDRLTAGVAGAARSSPHSLLQELLNRSDDALWGFVSNGLRLRILRDNLNFVRQAYIEFDLEAMMDGEVYSDFVVLWLLCHQSRVEGEKHSDFWLEKWSKVAQEQGIRALDHLRDGVEQAIEALGRGFLAHKANRELREKLQLGELDKQDFYRQILRLVYRLLFLFVAEDREVLLDPSTSTETINRYQNFYSTKRLRQLAERRFGTRHTDLFIGLKLVMKKLGDDKGCPELGLPALGSFLFSNDALPDIESSEVANHDFLDSIRALAFTSDGGVRRQVDYKNLGSEELGSVYEGLLELHPQLNVDAAKFELSTAGGNERKTTGSYYTPSSLINALLDSALDPVIDQALKKPDPEKALLDLKICDPACGSGHFLVAAAHRIAKSLAAVRTGIEEPSPEAVRHALRDVVGRCIYGVDINPMSVELCKVSLWMEALEPGKPLSFLDHHIRVGNSLLGTTPALLKQGIPDDAFKPIEGDDRKLCTEYKKQNKRERQQDSLLGFGGEPWENLGDLAMAMVNLEDISDDTIEGIKKRQERYESLVNSSGYLFGGLLADAWCAAFVWKKNRESGFPYAITEEEFRKIRKSPYSISPWMRDEIIRLSKQYNFFHWHLAFPDVFRIPTENEKPDNFHSGWSGGFHCILGNPPWEKMKIQEREWFDSRIPEIAHAQTAAERQGLIANLRESDPKVFDDFNSAKRDASAESHLVKHGGVFLLSTGGEVNTYSLFLELSEHILLSAGFAGLIVKTGILADYSMRKFFAHLVNNRRLVSAFDFANTQLIFPAVVANERFTLISIKGASGWNKPFKVSILNKQTEDLNLSGKAWELELDDIKRINPNTLTCPLFQTQKDAQIVRKIYQKFPVLIHEDEDRTIYNSFGCVYVRMFDMTLDSKLFEDLESLESKSSEQASPDWKVAEQNFVSLFEGKLFDSYDFRFGDFKGIPRKSRFGIKAEPNHPSDLEKQNPHHQSLPRYWVPTSEVKKRYAKQGNPSGVLMFRDVCRVHTDLRTVRASVAPNWGAGNKAPLLLFPNYSLEDQALRSAILCTIMNSLTFDYIARQKFAGGSLNRFILIQLPVIPFDSFDSRYISFVLPRFLELSYTAYDLESFAKNLSYTGEPFIWNENRRFLMRSEVDAFYFHIYGIMREDVNYILETFPILKRKDEASFGEYRTKRVILEIYDEMMSGGSFSLENYKTRLSPPPADPSVAHQFNSNEYSDAIV